MIKVNIPQKDFDDFGLHPFVTIPSSEAKSVRTRGKIEVNGTKFVVSSKTKLPNGHHSIALDVSHLSPPAIIPESVSQCDSLLEEALDALSEDAIAEQEAEDTSQPVKITLGERLVVPKPKIDVDPSRSWMNSTAMRGGWTKTLTLGLPQSAVDALLNGAPEFHKSFQDILQYRVNNKYLMVPIDLSRKDDSQNVLTAMIGVNYAALQSVKDGDFDTLLKILRNSISRQIGANHREDVDIPQGQSIWITTLNNDYTGNGDYFDILVTVNMTQSNADAMFEDHDAQEDFIEQFRDRLGESGDNNIVPFNYLKFGEKPSHTFTIGLNEAAVNGIATQYESVENGLLANTRSQIGHINRKVQRQPVTV